MNATRKPKRATPSFEVARAPLGGHDVWVYRSDVPAATPATLRVQPAVPPDAQRSPAPRDEPSRTSPRRTSPPARSAPGWIGTGIGVMMMPLTLTMMAMIVPALWIVGARSRR
jgi:hypothetical protein